MKNDEFAAMNRYAFCFVFDARGKVLVIRRAQHMRARPGEWDLPGGRADDGELSDDAIRREVWEETGLGLSELELVLRKQREWGSELHEFNYYRATKIDSSIVLSDEHTEYGWHDALVAAALIPYRPHVTGLQYIAEKIRLGI
jgi:8-oxo-dGTP pyrophosphatase MutT (NUDIX family)